MTADSQVFVNIIFSGALIVFAALLYRIVKNGALERKGGAKAPAETVVSSKAAPSPAPVRTVAAGMDDEVVAVISAAIASYMADAAPGVAYAVTGISPRVSRQKEQRPVWGFAGVKQNTDPF